MTLKKTLEVVRPHLYQLINIIWLLICEAPRQEHHFPIRVKVHGELQLILVVKKEVANVYNFNLRTVVYNWGQVSTTSDQG